MSNIIPDNWVVLRITMDSQSVYKVLAGWSGSYLDGSSWKLNSGIVRVEETDTHYLFHGSSGSTYTCGKQSYGLRTNNIGVYESLKQRFPDNIELMPEETNWLDVKYD